ncbi:MAG: hypothetical protein AAF915_23955 [Cyanobacteria bacterium P01_D01_bin.50]
MTINERLLTITSLGIMNAVVLILVLGSFVLAVLDKEFRPYFGDIVVFGLGGFTGQFVPKIKS